MIEPHLLMRVEELSRFLTNGIHPIAHVGKFLVEKTFHNLDLVTCYFLRSDKDGKLRFAGGHNLPKEVTSKWGALDINEDLPATDCVRNKEIVWLNGKNEWETKYPKIKNWEVNPQLETFINVPIQVEGKSIACLGLSSKTDLKKSEELTSFLIAISGLTGLYAHNLNEFRNNGAGEVSRKVLSRRQNQILDRIREKLTNREIGEELGFSESTIRQETMRIYQILQVDNRRKAAAFKFIED